MRRLFPVGLVGALVTALCCIGVLTPLLVAGLVALGLSTLTRSLDLIRKKLPTRSRSTSSASPPSISYMDAYGHDRIRNVLKPDVLAWQRALSDQGLAPATDNNHVASLSGFATWVHAQAPHLFAIGDPAKGIGELRASASWGSHHLSREPSRPNRSAP